MKRILIWLIMVWMVGVLISCTPPDNPYQNDPNDDNPSGAVIDYEETA